MKGEVGRLCGICREAILSLRERLWMVKGEAFHGFSGMHWLPPDAREVMMDMPF